MFGPGPVDDLLAFLGESNVALFCTSTRSACLVGDGPPGRNRRTQPEGRKRLSLADETLYIAGRILRKTRSNSTACKGFAKN